MTSCILYILVAVFVTAAYYRRFFNRLDNYDRVHRKEDAFIPAFFVGAFWLLVLPAFGLWALCNKILDKLTKV